MRARQWYAASRAGSAQNLWPKHTVNRGQTLEKRSAEAEAYHA